MGATQAKQQREKPAGWLEIRNSRGRLLFRLDVGRMLLEVKPKGGAVELIDLRPYLDQNCIDVEARNVVD